MQAVVVPGVPLGVQRANLAAAETEAVLVRGHVDASSVDRHDLAVKFEGLLLAVHALRTGDEFLRVGHVRCAARVQHATRVRQRLHQQASASGVIEMDVGQEDVVDVAAIEIVLLQRVEQVRHAVVGAGVDEGRAAVGDHQVAGVCGRSQVQGVDGDNAVACVGGARHLLRHVVSCPRSGSDYSTTVVSSPSRLA